MRDDAKPEPLTADDIPWALPPVDDDSTVDLLLFDPDGLYAYAASLRDDIGILRRLISALLALAHDQFCRLRTAKARIAQLLDSLQRANAEIRQLRARLHALGEDA